MMSPNERSRLDRDGYYVLHGVDAEDLLVFARDLGRPERDPRDKVLVKDIRPQPKDVANVNTLSSRYGMGAFPVHTEAAYLPSPPRFLLLYCVSPGSGGRTTVLLDGANLFGRMPKTHRPGTWVVKAGRRPFLCDALWRKSSTEFGIRYDRECLFPRGPTARSEEQWIRELISESTPTTIQWAEKQLLIVNNIRMLHGRGGSNNDDRDRWLKRVLVAEGTSNGLEQ
jgi:L-asparagine oxygenase